MLIRPISHDDLPALTQIASEAGPGFTSLAAGHEALARRIHRSVESFERSVTSPGEEGYLFVLEEPKTGEIMGVTGIEASVGMQRPLYHFRRQRALTGPGSGPHQEVLTASTAYTGCSEICTLFLRPRFRRPHAGKLLSRVRFLFMAQHPERFAPRVIAEMRGINENGRSVFWDWLRPRFIDLDFHGVTRRVGSGDTGFITDHLPNGPLALQQMPAAARAVIGQVHPHTRPALRLLEAEGFRHTGYVDLFDAGPTVEAPLAGIRSVADSIRCRIQAVAGPRAELANSRRHPAAPVYAVCNTLSDGFRALVTDDATYLPGPNLLQLPQALAEQLDLGTDAAARVVALNSADHRAAQSLMPHHNQTEELRHALR